MLLVVTLAALAFMVLRTGAFGAPKPAFLDLEGLPYLLAHLLVIGALMGALAIYLLDVFANTRLSDPARVAWAVALFVGNVFAMPLYWLLYLSRPRARAQ